MRKIFRPQMTLLSRIVLSFFAFCASLLLQMGIGRYQVQSVFSPLEESTKNIQEISQLLNSVENCLTALKDYRWDYGNPETLTKQLTETIKDSQQHLQNIQTDINRVSEEQYLLAKAVQTTSESLQLSLSDIVVQLTHDNNENAAQLYYEIAEPCGSYLRLYTQQLLEQAILDNQDTFNALTVLNECVNNMQMVLAIVSFVLGAAVVGSLFRLLRSVAQMAYASQEISQGNFDTPDLEENQKDEIGRMAIAFNEMKRSTKNQMQILNEKNEIERKLHKKEKEALEFQNLIEREKLQQLRSQINPHFLFNTLNVILYTAQQENAHRTQSLLNSLSELLRYSLGSNETQVPLSKEIHIVNAFYELHHVRFGDRIRLQWHISPDVIVTDMLVPSFILQPLVENAFKHGLAPKENGGCVDIHIQTTDDMLKIQVSDDGIGMSEELLAQLHENLSSPPTTGEHVGLYNVSARLRLWGKKYGMHVFSEKGKGTTVTLCLPIVIVGEEEEESDD